MSTGDSEGKLREALEAYVAKFGNCGKVYEQAKEALSTHSRSVGSVEEVLATLKEVCEKMELKEGSQNYELIKKGLSVVAKYNYGGYSLVKPDDR